MTGCFSSSRDSPKSKNDVDPVVYSCSVRIKLVTTDVVYYRTGVRIVRVQVADFYVSGVCRVPYAGHDNGRY